MTFATPVTALKFGFALSNTGFIANAVQVMLYDPSNHLLGTFTANAIQPPGDAFSNGQFIAPRVGLIAKAVVTFNSGAATAFGFDNLVISNAEEFQTRYAANLAAGESYIDIANTGASGASLLGPGFGAASGNICVNAYTFDAGEELISCCSCLITPDETVNLGVNRDLTVRTLTGVVPTSVTVKLLTTLAGTNGSGTSCTNSAATATAANLALGMAAWGTTLHSQNLSFATTETPFTQGFVSFGEIASITNRCAAILGNGSGFGVCNSCRAGALGASKLSN
jgi:hypothetical protein